MTAPSWSRYGSTQRRVCARAGCNAPAVATLRFQPTEREAWLAELDESAARTQGDLCQRHAAALVLPRGWELHDERRAVRARVAPAEVRPLAAEELRPVRIPLPRNAAVPEPAAASPPAAPPEPEPLFTPEPAIVEDEAAPDDEPSEPEELGDSNGNGARPIPAQFGSNDAEGVDDALDTILDARTPLLQRAFRNARPGDH